MPLETPSMENLSVLTGKYGEEGDQLIFKILNSGDFLNNVETNILTDYKKLTPRIAEKALRYDLTVPFARYVVMNRNEIDFPFKRYQIQPVWRADRPQKGRYREFYQCDADIVGTDSLLCEAEIIAMINQAFQALGIEKFSIKINNRKILAGIAEIADCGGRESDLCVAIDKLDKIGKEKVIEELASKGFTEDSLKAIDPVFGFTGSNTEKLSFLKSFLSASPTGQKGIDEIETVLKLAEKISGLNLNTELDITLARGLSYYTGAIFEVKALNVSIGSISGGGRYDNLTGVFGLPGVSGVGISFGIDRIYDVMEELKLFPEGELNYTQVLIAIFDNQAFDFCLPMLTKLRASGIKAEMYPDAVKMKKQMGYADSKKIPFVMIVGSDEMETGLFSLKNMETGIQEKLTIDQIIAKLG
jgi:histidyl-tRNA synthetase